MKGTLAVHGKRPDVRSAPAGMQRRSAALFLPFQIRGMTRCFIRGLLPAKWLRRPSLVAKPAAGLPIPKLSKHRCEKVCPGLSKIKLYGIVYVPTTSEDRARKVTELSEICRRQDNA